MFFRTTERRIAVIGGGEQAAQKTRLLLKTDGEIVLFAPEIDAELKAVVDEGRAIWDQSPMRPDLLGDAVLVFVATGCPGADASYHALAKAAGCIVNVVDQPHLCDIITPSIVDRDPLVVAIGSEGTAPVLARQTKTRVEELLDPSLGGLAAFAGRMRGAVAQRVPREGRRAFWRWVFADAPRRAWVRGRERDAIALVKGAIDAGGAPPSAGEGVLSFITMATPERDLLTLRAVERLQNADVIFYDATVNTDALELARRDAERVLLGTDGAAMVLAAAQEGQSVVWLQTVPTPAHEAEARAAGITVEVLPVVSE
ncbi:NAD(P)-dependent oxidoreductase [Celeribacter sp.]|uniref:NAD(P)-dependent oxidoreductase n=1 Tax=Celeribacter sp. TaxID=1890673 RepID=UPI003A94289C